MADHAPKPRRPDDGSRPPVWMIHVIIIIAVAHLVPLALVAESRTSKKEKPPVHIFLDMDAQPKLKAQAQSPVFADQRAMRPRIEGTVARGELAEDDHYHRGYETGDDGRPIEITNATGAKDYRWIDGYPQDVKITRDFVQRGRERYDIFCAPCHGISGQGNGMIHQRAVEVGSSTTGWVAPSNIVGRDPDGTLTYGNAKMPDGKLFHTIGYGARSMRGYASQIPVHDRWAIVAYIRALQLGQNAPKDTLSPEQLQKLRSR